MLSKVELGINIGVASGMVVLAAGFIVAACTSFTAPLTIGLLATGAIFNMIFHVANIVLASQELASDIKQVKTDKVQGQQNAYESNVG